MVELWKGQDEKMNLEKENKPKANKKKNRNVLFCVSYSRYFSMSTHRVIGKKKTPFNLSWARVQMYYHIFNNLSKFINGYLAAKLGWEFSPAT